MEPEWVARISLRVVDAEMRLLPTIAARPTGPDIDTLPVPDDTAAMTALLVAQIDLIDR
jgi:hypothetical protein